MSDFNEGNYVAQHNDLIVGRWGLNNTQLKLFEMAVSCIDTKQPKPDRKVTISKQDIFNLFEYSASNKYVVFQNHIKELQKQSVTVTEKNGKKRSLVLVPTVEWGSDDEDNIVTFYFNEHIMPYLLELQGHFTQYEILEIKGMRSQYSLVIFKYLVMEHNRKIFKPDYSSKGYVDILVTLDDVRYMTATEKKYNAVKDFRKYVLDVAMTEINAVRDNETGKTNFLVKYETIHGKYNKVTHIKFFVRRKRSAFDNDFDNPMADKYDVNAPRSTDESKMSADDFHRGYYEQKKKMTQEEITKFESELSEGKW